jgi:hypothetical protein
MNIEELDDDLAGLLDIVEARSNPGESPRCCAGRPGPTGVDPQAGVPAAHPG